jgi:hypothetical protein
MTVNEDCYLFCYGDDAFNDLVRNMLIKVAWDGLNQKEEDQKWWKLEQMSSGYYQFGYYFIDADETKILTLATLIGELFQKAVMVMRKSQMKPEALAKLT